MVNPYGHVPIPTDEDDVPKSIVDTPVFHDGQQSKGLVSGELRCTLTALTPLIVANDQLEAKDVKGAHRAEDGKVTLPKSWKVSCPVAADKKIVEPLRDQQGRVLIQGPSIKGMIEASLGALLCAPMARVEAGTKQRKLLVPHPKERRLSGEGKHRAPTMLTGARLITGYAVNKCNPGEMGLGEGDFTQLAGRIAINFAVEHLADGTTKDNQRFLSKHGDYVVPLKVLGMPREKSGELAGRKFYRHQPEARKCNKLYRGSHTPDGRNDTKNLASKQSKFARFVSNHGTRFRFTLRFRDLRHWELGAVLVCLRPTLLQDREAALATPDQQSPSHAVKLGQGRPLGLGSVLIDIDRVIDIDTLLGDDQQDASNEDRLARASLSAFAEKVGNTGQEARDEWLDLHRYADAKPAAYPTAKDKDGEHHIYHLRRDHSKGRRRR